MVQIVVHQLVPKTNQKNYDGEKKVQSSGRWRRLRIGGNDTTGKKTYSRLAGYVFQRVQITTGKIYDWNKKVQSSRLTGRFFRRVHITTRKNYDRKNKRYSHLADGGGSDLAGTLRPKKKT